MYFDHGALSLSAVLSSRAIMTMLTRKYEKTAEMLCGIDENKNSKLTSDEILMLIRTPSHRLLLERYYNKLIGKTVPNDNFFENLFSIKIDQKSLLKTSYNPMYDLITPAPFLTSIINPLPNSNKESQDELLLCKIYNSFAIFSDISSEWKITPPTNFEIEKLKTALRDLGKIALEPIEDIAFNVRFIAIVEFAQQETEIIPGASYSFPILPGVIFLGGSALEEPALLIESLYHESLHIKLINTFNAFDLLRFEMLQDTESFNCPWGKSAEDKVWPFMRAIGGYHVYCHLLAFHRLVINQNGPFNEWSNERIPAIREKLHPLREYINNLKSSKIMTESGMQYFDLIGEIGEM